jgi:hypothetical protein
MGFHQGRMLREAIAARVATPIPPAIADVVPAYAARMRDLLPPDYGDELRGIAAGAGVAADALFVREIVREILRWHDPATPTVGVSIAAAPGDAPCVATAYERAALLAPALVLVERLPLGGPATLLLAAPGSVGGIAGIAAAAGGRVVVAGEDASRAPEQRSLRGPPWTAGVRMALERGADVDAALDAVPKMLGVRVLVADAANRRGDAVVALAGEDPSHGEPGVWVLRPAGVAAAHSANAARQDAKLGNYASRPGCDDAGDLAEAGRDPEVAEPVLRWTLRAIEASTPGGAFRYGWAR